MSRFQRQRNENWHAIYLLHAPSMATHPSISQRESIRWVAKGRKTYGSLEEAPEQKDASETPSKKSPMIFASQKDSSALGRQNMMNIHKFTRSATTTSTGEAKPKLSHKQRSLSEHHRSSKPGNNKVISDTEPDFQRSSITSISGTIFGPGFEPGKSSSGHEQVDIDIDDEETQDPSAFKKCWKKITKIVSSQIGLLVILFAYSFIGAAIFQAIEGPHEEDVVRNITHLRNQLIQSAWNASQSLGNQTNFTETFEEHLHEYEEQLNLAFQHGIQAGKDLRIWDYWGALFFSCTVYTTIGYGHIAPSTDWGRIATMVYATIGIPLFFVVMANLGRMFTRVIKYLWSYVRMVYYTQTCKRIRKAKTITAMKERILAGSVKCFGESPASTSSASRSRNKSSAEMTDTDSYVDYEVDDQFNLHPFVAITITMLYIFGGALMYVQWEPWTYLEAFYFIFVSVSTIGFGDVIPDHPNYFLASSVYILLGLSLVAMVINVIMEFFNHTLSKAREKVENISRSMGLDLDDDEQTISRKKIPSPPGQSKESFSDMEDPFSDEESPDSNQQHMNKAFSMEDEGPTVKSEELDIK